MSGRRVPSIYTNSIYSRPSTDSNTRNVPEQSSRHLQYPSNGGSRSRTESATSMYSRASNSSHPSASQQPASTPQTPARAAPTAPPASTASPAPIAAPASNTLLLAISGRLDPSLKTYVQTALSRASSISEIAILGPQVEEQALKQLKVDMYALAGKMEKGLGVNIAFMQGWSAEDLHRGIAEVLGLEKKANGVGAMAERWGGSGAVSEKTRALRGVILDMPAPRDGIAETEAGMADLLDLETGELEEGWKRSVGFLHAFARETVPLLRIAAHHEQALAHGEGDGSRLQHPFFVTTLKSRAAVNPSINETSVRALLDGLSRATGNRGITFGRVDHLLIPDPEPVPAEIGQPVVAPTNGWNDTAPESPGGESPTKLWGMWSMQNELASFD